LGPGATRAAAPACHVTRWRLAGALVSQTTQVCAHCKLAPFPVARATPCAAHVTRRCRRPALSLVRVAWGDDQRPRGRKAATPVSLPTAVGHRAERWSPSVSRGPTVGGWMLPSSAAAVRSVCTIYVAAVVLP